MIRSVKCSVAWTSAIVLAATSSAAQAATATTSFSVTVTINSSCVINSASALSFGSTGVLSANLDQTSTIVVQCTNSTSYNIGLDAGTGTGATVSARKMTNGANTINYALYSDVSRSVNWGNSVGVDTVSATGNGAAQSYTVYGRIPAQTTPAAGAYSDTITVTVTY